MIENYNLLLLIGGFAFLLGALFPIFFKRIPISLPILQVLFGIAIGYWWTGLTFLVPIDNSLTIEEDTLKLWIVCSILILASILSMV